MGWLFAIVVLLVFIWLLVAFPGFRIAVLAVIILGGVAIYQYVSAENERQAKALTLIKPTQLAFNEIKLGQSYGGSWKVAGTVQNHSTLFTLSGFTLRVVVRDCPGDDSSCVTIGQDDVGIYSVTVPPGQLRTFDGYVSLYNMPTPQRMVWDYRIISVKAAMR